jgi:hypothetical protein
MEAISHYDAAYDGNSDHVIRVVDGRPHQDEAASSLSFASLLENFMCESLVAPPAIESRESFRDSDPASLLF